MNFADVCVKEWHLSFSLADFSFSVVLLPSVTKGTSRQAHYVLPSAGKSAFSLGMDLRNSEDGLRTVFEGAMEDFSVDGESFPYGFTGEHWWQYCMAPHSYLSLGRGKCQVGLNMFNRFLHLDLNTRSAQWVDPGISDGLLSSTNYFDTERQELWFASWAAEETVRRIRDPQGDVLVAIWRLSVQDGHIKRVWQGSLADSLHQLALSPDRSFLVLTELGMRREENPGAGPHGSSDLNRGVIPSQILVLDLKTGVEWRVPMTTAGHVEFDPDVPDICYLSGHNIGLMGVRVGIFGTGKIQKFRLRPSGPEFLGEFTHPRFHRITTHIVFRHRGRNLIGVSGYPGTIFLIDSETMGLYKTIEIDSKEEVDASVLPHICRRDSYGIAASGDGQHVLAGGTGFVRVADVDSGEIVFSGGIEGYGEDSCFTGHAGNLCPGWDI